MGPVVAAFVTFGLFWGSWAVMVFNIQRTFALSDAGLGVLLALAIALAGHLQRGHGPPGQPRRRPPPALDRPVGLVGSPRPHERRPAEVGLRRFPGARRDRRGQHRHRHERRGDAPLQRPALRPAPIPRPLQLRSDRGCRRGRGSSSTPACHGAGSGPGWPSWRSPSVCGRSPSGPSRRRTHRRRPPT